MDPLQLPHACQNYGPFLGSLDIRCCIIIGVQKGDHNFENHSHAILGPVKPGTVAELRPGSIPTSLPVRQVV